MKMRRWGEVLVFGRALTAAEIDDLEDGTARITITSAYGYDANGNRVKKT